MSEQQTPPAEKEEKPKKPLKIEKILELILEEMREDDTVQDVLTQRIDNLAQQLETVKQMLESKKQDEQQHAEYRLSHLEQISSQLDELIKAKRGRKSALLKQINEGTAALAATEDEAADKNQEPAPPAMDGKQNAGEAAPPEETNAPPAANTAAAPPTAPEPTKKATGAKT